jgi:DNA-directed RNA polymerase specialized sigma24 family protein
MAQGVGEIGASVGDLRLLEDRDLLPFVARGHPAALGVMYDRHIGVVWKLALMSCGDTSTAEGAVHDAFLNLWRRPYANGSQQPVVRLLAVVRAACRSPSARPAS